MNTLYEKFYDLKIDTACIGLAHEENSNYFCTPLGTKIIGWDNGIHYGFINGFGEMVFAVNPDTCCEFYVYPLAQNFTDFLRLILSVKGTNALQQIIQWNKQQYTDFLTSPEEIEYASQKIITDVLAAIQSLGITPMEQPFEYVKRVQNEFDYSRIVFDNDYYDLTGKPNPN